MPKSNAEITDVVRNGMEKLCEDVTAQIAPLGFVRTKKVFWSRRQPLTLDFIHFHRGGISYGRPTSFQIDVRVHFGIRVLNSPPEGPALNGPCTDPRTKYGGGYKYHLGFNAQTGRLYDRCLSDILRFIGLVGEPWFARFREVDDLLKLPDSPLSATEKLDLQAARAGKWNPGLVAASLKLFGIKE